MFKSLASSRVITVVLFVAAAALLAIGGIGAAQAAPRIQSADYRAQVHMADDIDTAIVENEVTLEDGAALLSGLVADGEALELGRAYDERLAVNNTGQITEYVRVTVTKYWTRADANGNQVKQTDLDPALIELSFSDGSGWTVDQDASTRERTVLYYATVIDPGQTTEPFTSTIAISEAVKDPASGDYQDAQVNVTVTADAVQQHNGDAAMVSAWGRTNE